MRGGCRNNGLGFFVFYSGTPFVTERKGFSGFDCTLQCAFGILGSWNTPEWCCCGGATGLFAFGRSHPGSVELVCVGS